MTAPANSRTLRFQQLEQRYALDGDPALLANGDEVRREVGQEDPFDEFFFDSPAGELVLLSVGEERAVTGNTVQLIVETPSGSTIVRDDPNSAFYSFETTESGRYKVFVREAGNDQDFDYKLRFITTAGLPTRSGALDAFLLPGERRGGTLEFGQLSLVQFDANAGASVYTTLGETGGSGSPRLWLFGPDGDLHISTSDSTGISSNFTATRTGTYSAIIGENNGDAFLPFTFSVSSFPGEIDYDQEGNTFLASGERHVDTIAVGQQHFVQFGAAAGDRIYATIGDTAGPGAVTARIVDPNGRFVEDTFLSDNDGGQIVFDAFTSGLYTAVISESGSDSQLSYTMSLAVLPGQVDYALPQNTFLQSGERHAGTVAVGEQDLVQFGAAAGDRIYATIGDTAGPGAVTVRIVDPNGRFVEDTFLSDNDGGELGFFALTTGVYTAVISESGSDSTLSYRFRHALIERESPSSSEYDSTLMAGVEAQQVLGLGDFAIHPFFMAESDSFQIVLSEQSTTGGSPRLQVFDPTGLRLWNGTDSTSLTASVSALQAGQYFAIVSDSGSDNSLGYTLTATGISNALPEVPGDFDGNLRVDVSDYRGWREHYGRISGEALYADFNRDGRVDGADYTVWRDNLGAVVSPPDQNVASLSEPVPQSSPPQSIDDQLQQLAIATSFDDYDSSQSAHRRHFESSPSSSEIDLALLLFLDAEPAFEDSSIREDPAAINLQAKHAEEVDDFPLALAERVVGKLH